jgi:hypothetical protein
MFADSEYRNEDRGIDQRVGIHERFAHGLSQFRVGTYIGMSLLQLVTCEFGT